MHDHEVMVVYARSASRMRKQGDHIKMNLYRKHNPRPKVPVNYPTNAVIPRSKVHRQVERVSGIES